MQMGLQEEDAEAVEVSGEVVGVVEGSGVEGVTEGAGDIGVAFEAAVEVEDGDDLHLRTTND